MHNLMILNKGKVVKICLYLMQKKCDSFFFLYKREEGNKSLTYNFL